MSEELDMSPAARWARVEAERVKRGESKTAAATAAGSDRGAATYITSMKKLAQGMFLSRLEERYGLPRGAAEARGSNLGRLHAIKRPPAPTPFGLDHTLVSILDRHHIGEPGDHIMLRLGILSERLKNIGGEK